MNTGKLNAKVTLLTSVSHNGETVGNQAVFHRLGMVMPGGQVEQIPTITGNSIRGQLRDALALDVYETLGLDVALPRQDLFGEALPTAQFSKFHDTILAYLLFSGGALTKDSISEDQVSQLRDLLPGLALLGGGVGNTIIHGKLDVGMLIPIAYETAHLLPHRQPSEVSVYSLMQTEAYTRTDDGKNINLRGAFPEDDKPVMQMRYEMETMMAGAELDWHVYLERVTDVQLGALVTALDVWGRRPVLGGVGRIGHGLCKIEFDNGWMISPDERRLPKDLVDQYHGHLATHREAILKLMVA